VCRLDRPADTTLGEFFRRNRGLGSHDRPFIADTVFGILRNKRLLEALAPAPDPRHLVLASLAKLQNFPIDVVQSLASDTDQAWLSEIQQTGIEQLPAAVQLSLPDWLWHDLVAQYGEERAIRLGKALLEPASLDLRVNTMQASRDQVMESLAGSGIEARPTPYSPIGIRLRDKPSLNRNELYLNGSVEPQDEGSQLLGLLVAPARRQMVVDFCAGAGGKTLLLGAMMHNQGRLYAFDVSAKRLETLKQRVQRAGLTNVQPQMIGSEHDPRIARLAGKIDRVLVDAPCSGLGTLRRSPELKWRQSPESIAKLADQQRRILDAASQLLKPGARLVYATCSLLARENEDIVEAFLDGQEGRFRLRECQPIPDNSHVSPQNGLYFNVLPDTHHCDGFFAAVLERTAQA
jgi:16S rRNA (cytosine967-C5)-methyltransferase